MKSADLAVLLILLYFAAFGFLSFSANCLTLLLCDDPSEAHGTYLQLIPDFQDNVFTSAKEIIKRFVLGKLNAILTTGFKLSLIHVREYRAAIKLLSRYAVLLSTDLDLQIEEFMKKLRDVHISMW